LLLYTRALVGLGFIFIDTSNDHFRSIFRSQYLNEGVLMRYLLLADFTVVEVFAYTTLVSHSSDWSNSAAITGYMLVGDNVRLRLSLTM